MVVVVVMMMIMFGHGWKNKRNFRCVSGVGALGPSCLILSRNEQNGEGVCDARKSSSRGAFRDRGNGSGQRRVFARGRLARTEGPTARYPGPPLAGDGCTRHRGDAAFPQRSGRAGDTRSKQGQRNIAPLERLSGRTDSTPAEAIWGTGGAADANP